MDNITSITSKQRQLIADMDTPDQVKTLHSLIKNHHRTAGLFQFSPELALYILDNLNVGNRTQKARSISVCSGHDQQQLVTDRGAYRLR